MVIALCHKYLLMAIMLAVQMIQWMHFPMDSFRNFLGKVKNSDQSNSTSRSSSLSLAKLQTLGELAFTWLQIKQDSEEMVYFRPAVLSNNTYFHFRADHRMSSTSDKFSAGVLTLPKRLVANPSSKKKYPVYVFDILRGFNAFDQFAKNKSFSRKGIDEEGPDGDDENQPSKGNGGEEDDEVSKDEPAEGEGSGKDERADGEDEKNPSKGKDGREGDEVGRDQPDGDDEKQPSKGGKDGNEADEDDDESHPSKGGKEDDEDDDDESHPSKGRDGGKDDDDESHPSKGGEEDDTEDEDDEDESDDEDDDEEDEHD